MLAVIVVAVARTRSLLTAIILTSVYSFISALWLVVMDAADVSFTEAVVGAGVSTIIALGAILLTRSECSRIPWREIVLQLILVTITGGVLAYAVLDLPALGDPSSPANSYVGRLYLEHAEHDIGTPNIVTAVLSSYRGFDTLGETTVIFSAGLAVALLLGFGERALQDTPRPSMATMADSGQHVVLRVAAKLLIPMISIYAFYVQFHGDLGPGGGFQAGVIMAVAIILHALVFGLQDTMEAIPPQLARGLSAIGVLLYAGVGIVNLANGGNFLDYDHLFPRLFEEGLPDSHLVGGHHIWGQHFGILVIELGVFLTVASTMVTIFYAFAGRAPDFSPPEEG